MGVNLFGIADRDLFGKIRIQPATGNPSGISISNVLDVGLVHLHGVDPLAMLIDKLDHVFKESMKTLTLKI